MHREAAGLAVMLMWLSAGCLDGGPPPTGEHLLSGRDIVEVAWVPPPPGESPPALRLLVVRSPSPKEGPYALSLHTWPANGGAPTEWVLGSRYPVTPYLNLVQDGTVSRGLLATDSMGRIFVIYEGSLSRIDLSTGDTVALGSFSLSMSPSRARVLVDNGQAGTTVLESQGGRLFFEKTENATLCGEDLFVNEGGSLERWASDGSITTIASDVLSFRAARAGGHTIVAVERASSSGGAGNATSIVDLASGTEMAVPGPVAVGYEQSFLSPNGRWILVDTSPANDFKNPALIEAATGRSASIDFGSNYANWGYWWRPGHDELWFRNPRAENASGYPTAVSLLVARPADDTVVHLDLADTDRVGWSGVIGLPIPPMFTPDGEYWLSAAGSVGADRVPSYAGPADDPTAPRVVLNPSGSGINGLFQLPDGRLLVQAMYFWSTKRADLLVVDPATGASRKIGDGGHLVTLGAQRVLALQNVVDDEHPGDLSLIDVASGATTWLGQSVAQAAAENAAPGEEALGPGTHVAFVLRNPIASPYDGVWLATLP